MTLKSGSWVIQDHRKWHYSIDRILVPIDIPLTMALSCIVSAIKRYTGCKSRFATHPAFSSHVRGSPSEYCHKVWYGKTRMVDLRDSEKSLRMCLFRPTRFDTMCERDGQTDLKTDTARRHRPRLCTASRGKNARWPKVVVMRDFLTARRVCTMHSADYAVARCPSVRHTPVLCLNGYTYPQSFYTIG